MAYWSDGPSPILQYSNTPALHILFHLRHHFLQRASERNETVEVMNGQE
jgi:hypothetical protein